MKIALLLPFWVSGSQLTAPAPVTPGMLRSSAIARS
jgi:hypothetical protein